MRTSRARPSGLAAAALLVALVFAASPAPPSSAATLSAVAVRVTVRAAAAESHGRRLTASADPVGGMATIGVGRLPSSVAVDPASGTVWVVNSQDNTVSEISEARRAVVATIKVGVSPVDVAVDQKTATVWVTCLGPFDDPSADNAVSEISEASRKVVATIKVGQVPFGIAADSRTGTVWVANTNSYTVSEISESARAVVATIHTGTGAEPVNLAVDPSRAVVWVATLGSALDEISEASRSVVAAIGVGPGRKPNGLDAVAVDTSTGAAWVASDYYAGGSYASYASIVFARHVTLSVPVSKPDWFTNVADGVAVDPGTGTVWVAENGADSVTLISQHSNGVARNLPAGDKPVAIAVDPHTETLWVVDNAGDAVTTYAYTSPRFTTSPQFTVPSGKPVALHVHTIGFPICVMRTSGGLPPGMRLRLGSGTVVISGTPAAAARDHTYRITVSADNGVGAHGQDGASQQVVIRVT